MLNVHAGAQTMSETEPSSSEFEPGKMINILLEHDELRDLISQIKKESPESNMALLIPHNVGRLEEEIDDHFEDYVFLPQANDVLRRALDNLIVKIKMEENICQVGLISFNIVSSFQMDTDAISATVYVLESYDEPLLKTPLAKKIEALQHDLEDLAKILIKLDLDQKSERVQEFYTKIEAVLKDHSDSYLDQVKLLEKKIMEYLDSYDDHDAAIQDKILIDKMSSLDKAEQAEDSDGQHLLSEEALSNLKLVVKSLEKARLPEEKLDIIMEFFDKVCSELETSGTVPNADVLIPALMLAMIKTKPRHLISDLRYIQRFCNHSRLTGQVAYRLTNILAVVSLIESAQVDRLNGESIYQSVSRTASQLDLDQDERLGDKTEPESPSMLMRPFSELNLMASNVFTKVSFYPRAFSTAVAESFRRSKTLEEQAKPVGSKWTERQLKHPDTGEQIEEDVEIRGFRHRIMGMEKFDELSVREIPMIFADYRKLLMTFCFEQSTDNKK